MRDDCFYSIQGWMVNGLKLSGNELICYAIIYGFSQDGESMFMGTSKYLQEWMNVSQPTVLSILAKLVKKKLIIKIDNEVDKVKYCYYKVSDLRNLSGGTKESLVGGTKESLVYNNIDNNIIDNKNISLSNDKQKSDESFNILWSKYKKGSKQNAINQWNKLKDKEKELVLNTVDDYITYCRRSNRPLKDVSAYLHQKCFNDDWNVIPEYYIIREGDDARCQKFKEWMCSKFKDLLYHRNPLTYEQAQELFDEHPVSSIRIAMEKLSSRDIHQYYNIKSGIEKILESDEL